MVKKLIDKYNLDEDGFSLIELVVAVGILAILSVVGVVAYSNITENARKTAVESAAAEVYTAAVAYDVDGDSGTDPMAVGAEWVESSKKDSEGNALITVDVSKNTNGELCVVANGYDHSSSKGAGCEGNTGNPDDNDGVIVPPIVNSTPEECFTFSNGIITGYDEVNCEKDVVIPSTINGEAVVEIGSGAFAGNGLTSVVIPDSVKTIGAGAFDSNQLTSVDLGEGVETIGSSAFGGNRLTSVSVPNSVKTIVGWAFSYNDLTSVVIPNGVETIGQGAFYGNQLISVSLPDSVQTIEIRAFVENELTSVSIYSSTSVEDGAFDREVVITRR